MSNKTDEMIFCLTQPDSWFEMLINVIHEGSLPTFVPGGPSLSSEAEVEGPDYYVAIGRKSGRSFCTNREAPLVICNDSLYYALYEAIKNISPKLHEELLSKVSDKGVITFPQGAYFVQLTLPDEIAGITVAGKRGTLYSKGDSERPDSMIATVNATRLLYIAHDAPAMSSETEKLEYQVSLTTEGISKVRQHPKGFTFGHANFAPSDVKIQFGSAVALIAAAGEGKTEMQYFLMEYINKQIENGMIEPITTYSGLAASQTLRNKKNGEMVLRPEEVHTVLIRNGEPK